MSIYNDDYGSVYPKLNSDNIELYKFKFGRYPRERSIEDIQLIWINSIKRTKERRDRIINVINKIVKEIPEDKFDHKIVYYIDNNELYYFDFSRYISGNWHFSKRKFIFSEDKSISREEKINLILNNERAFQLGEEMRKSLIWETNYHELVGSVFIKIIGDKLKKYYKGNKNIPNISIVKIGDIKYYFFAQKQNGFGTLRFKFMGEVTDEIITI
jgi:hypothetical protein